MRVLKVPPHRADGEGDHPTGGGGVNGSEVKDSRPIRWVGASYPSTRFHLVPLPPLRAGRNRQRFPPPRPPPIGALISGNLKGWPLVLVNGRASTKFWSRSRVLSCPVFISGTMICS